MVSFIRLRKKARINECKITLISLFPPRFSGIITNSSDFLITSSINMPTFIQQIDHLHSQCSLMDKMGRVAYLCGQYQRLNQLAYRYGMYLQRKGSISPYERQHAQQLIDMINSVQSKGVEASKDFSNEMLKELTKCIGK